MISYKYNIYRSKKTKYLDKMLRECCFVWNHALALQRRYYKLFGKYISIGKMKKHFAKRIKRNLLHSQTTQEILERLDESYNRYWRARVIPAIVISGFLASVSKNPICFSDGSMSIESAT